MTCLQFNTGCGFIQNRDAAQNISKGSCTKISVSFCARRYFDFADVSCQQERASACDSIKILGHLCNFRQNVSILCHPEPTMLKTLGLLLLSNIFMTFAWYGHLKTMGHKPLYFAILVSWGIAFFEYCLQVPANRNGFQFFTLAQLKIVQEVLTLLVFVVFSIFYMKEKPQLNLLWAGLCLIGAVYFIFRDGPGVAH
jgi:uncharacterized protein